MFPLPPTGWGRDEIDALPEVDIGGQQITTNVIGAIYRLAVSIAVAPAL